MLVVSLRSLSKHATLQSACRAISGIHLGECIKKHIGEILLSNVFCAWATNVTLARWV